MKTDSQKKIREKCVLSLCAFSCVACEEIESWKWRFRSIQKSKDESRGEKERKGKKTLNFNAMLPGIRAVAALLCPSILKTLIIPSHKIDAASLTLSTSTHTCTGMPFCVTLCG